MVPAEEVSYFHLTTETEAASETLFFFNHSEIIPNGSLTSQLHNKN
jgi:hypothetical protein